MDITGQQRVDSAGRSGWPVWAAAALMAAVAVLAVADMFVVRPAPDPIDQPAFAGSVSGTVTTVSADGTALCLHAARSQDSQCFGVWLLRGERPPAVSDRVAGWIVRVPRGTSLVEELILQPAAPRASGEEPGT